MTRAIAIHPSWTGASYHLLSTPLVRSRRPLELEVAQHHAAEHDHVAVAQVGLLHASAVDERAVRAAVIEDPRTGAARHEDRVAARDRALVEVQIGGQAAADPD